VTSLFDPIELGRLRLANRIVMAPMTRSRADSADAPTELHVEYYRQRAGAGMIISEGTQPSPHGKGYCRTPGIYSVAQVAAWRRVTDAVHTAGGRIVMQLMHVGRVAHRHNKAADAETVAPSLIRVRGQVFTDAAGMQDFDVPRVLETHEIPKVIEEFRQATRNALAAGFDGVELHAASGYLPMQFLSSGTNWRTDRYGGSAENRVRFVVETLTGMSEVAGADRIGLRICPGTRFNDVHDEDPDGTYTTLLHAVRPLRLAYLHLIYLPNPRVDSLALAREIRAAPLLLNESINFEMAEKYVGDRTAAAVSFARYFIANPDLVHRWRIGAPLAAFESKTLYTAGAKGYIDYPALA
jgi:N-ethylmaleimide reductase